MVDIDMPVSVSSTFLGAAGAYQNSLSNQLWLILAAVVCVYIVLGVLYESYIHPLTILSTLPSAGVGALLALWLTGNDLGVIGIIGIILLIGIVKKNAIMMIDFAISAERDEGKSPRDAIFQAAILRFRPILMTTLAALFAAVPLMLSFGDGAELRRPLGIAIFGGLLVSQLLTMFTTPSSIWPSTAWVRPASASVRKTRSASPTRSRGRRLEPVGALHPAARRHRPADHRPGHGRHRGLLRAAGLAAAAGGLSDHLGVGQPVGRQPRGYGLQRRHAAGAPAGHDLRGQRNDLAELDRLYPGDPAVRPQPQDRRRRPRGAGRHQRRAGRPAGDAEEQSQLPQGQPVRRAGDHPGPDLGHQDPRPDL
jgi:hypothetical protein